MKRSVLILMGLVFLVSLPLPAAKHQKNRSKLKAKAKVATSVAINNGFESDLLDWSIVPFSDLSSHGVLVRQPVGLAAWRLRSSFAFGSQAATPHPAKDLVDLRLEWKVEGETSPRFASTKPELKSFARWVQESAQDGDLRADIVTVFSATDAVVAACTLTNVGTKLLRIRPVVRLGREQASGFKAQVEASPRFPALWLGLDRGAMVGRPLQEWTGVWMGAQAWRVEADPAFITGHRGDTEPLGLTRGASIRQDGGLGLSLTWTLPQLLAPKQSLRLPLMLVWGTDKSGVQTLGQKEWVENALPQGKAWKQAQDRWQATRLHLPLGVDPHWVPSMKRAALALT